jgi:hypothetical protein
VAIGAGGWREDVEEMIKRERVKIENARRM